MRSRVLIFSIAYEPLVGGAELAVRNITDRLPFYDFDLITCRFKRQHPTRERIGNVNVYRVGFGSRVGRYLYPALAWRLARRLHQKQPYQIVWSIMAAYAGATALMFLRRFPQVKYLLTLQEGDPIVHIHRQVRGFKQMWQRIFGRADYIAAISRYLGDWARKEGATCPIELVPNGVAVEKFEIRNPKFETNSKSQIFKIITTSRLVHKNGIDILIKAVAKLKFLIPNSQFLIQVVGSGPEESKLRKLTKELGVEEMIDFVGEVAPDKIPEYLAQADIFARPSRSEGLGSSFLEAMAAGLPVIGTRVGGIGDFLIDYNAKGANGLFTKIEDPKDFVEKIKLLIEDQELRLALGRNGRSLVCEKYDWEKIAAQMDTIFQKLVT